MLDLHTMPKNDEGEFELVLGNKQLLSVFFIVVVLLGVFFTMGYIVGRNTGGDGVEVAQAPGQPLVVDSGTSRPPQTATAAPPPAPKPANPKPAAAPPKPTPTPPKQTPPPRPKPTPPPAPKPAPPSPAGVAMPSSGQVFLQVAATSSPEGQVLRDVLRKRGFAAQLAPVPGQDLVRVLVGPLSGTQDISQNRTKLQEAGFKPFTRKY